MSAPYNYTQYYSSHGKWYYSFEGRNSFTSHKIGMNIINTNNYPKVAYGAENQQFLILPKELL